MRRWPPFSLVLTLLVGCSTTPSEEPSLEGEESSSSAELEASAGKPCGRTPLLLADVAPGAASSEPGELVDGSRVLLFTVGTEDGRALWRSSGTGGPGTRFVKALPSGPTGLQASELTRVGSRVFFVAASAEHGRELWVSDGTPAGTRMVKDIWPGEEGSFPTSLYAYDGLLYFAAGSPEHGRELWRSDGTAEGTFMVEDLEPGPEGTSPNHLTRGGDGALYFIVSRDPYRVLMRGDGGPGAVELRRVPDSAGLLERLTPAGKRLFFIIAGDAHDDTVSLEVTSGGKAPVRLGTFHAFGDMVALGGRVYFSAAMGHAMEEGAADGELWRSDGSVKGTGRVKDIRPGPEGSSPSGLRVLGNRLVFVADDGTSGREPWVSNGTASGTALLADLEPGAAGSFPEALTVIQSTLFFSAETVGHGREPWVSDGTRKGTVPLDGLAPGSASSNPSGFVLSGWDVFFTAEDGTHGREPWVLPFRPSGHCERDPAMR
jgi:ELWxxDGT repeat protein